MTLHLRTGRPHQLGARFDGEGTNFAVFSANADRINLCLFSPDGSTELDRVRLPERTGHILHGLRPRAKTGQPVWVACRRHLFAGTGAPV